MELIVWQDMINAGGRMNLFHHFVLTNYARRLKIKDNKYKVLGREGKANRDNYKKELKEMIDTLYNVPSIGMWIPFNEAWGQFEADMLTEIAKHRMIGHITPVLFYQVLRLALL